MHLQVLVAWRVLRCKFDPHIQQIIEVRMKTSSGDSSSHYTECPNIEIVTLGASSALAVLVNALCILIFCALCIAHEVTSAFAFVVAFFSRW